MLRSLVPIVALIVIFAYFCMPKAENKVNTINPHDDITSMAEYGEFAIAAPTALDTSWKPTSSQLLRDGDQQIGTPTGLTIGYVTPKTKFARFTIRQGEPAAVLKESVDDATVTDDPAGAPVQIADRSWTPITTNNGRGYVNISGSGAASVVIVLVGSASFDELKQLATALQPVAKKS